MIAATAAGLSHVPNHLLVSLTSRKNWLDQRRQSINNSNLSRSSCYIADASSSDYLLEGDSRAVLAAWWSFKFGRRPARVVLIDFDLAT